MTILAVKMIPRRITQVNRSHYHQMKNFLLNLVMRELRTSWETADETTLMVNEKQHPQTLMMFMLRLIKETETVLCQMAVSKQLLF